MHRSLSVLSLPTRYVGLAFAQRLTASPHFLRYSVVVSLFLIALAGRFALADLLPAEGFPFLTFFPAVFLATYLAGLGPGLLTSVLSVGAACFFFIQPDRSVALTRPDWVALIFFSVILLIDCLVIHFMKTALLRVSSAEKRSRDSDQQLRMVLDNLSVYVSLLDLDGTVREVNEKPLQRVGLHRDQILGLPLWKMIWWAGDVDQQNQVRAAIARAAGGDVVRFDLQANHLGYRVTIDFQVGPLRASDGRITALVASGVNVSARANAIAALQASRQDAIIAAQAAEAERHVLDATFNAVPAAIIVADASGKALRMNLAVEQIWGAVPITNSVNDYEQWKGWWADGLAHHGQRLTSNEWGLARSLKGEICHDIVEIQPFDAPGERRVTLVSSAPMIDTGGQVVGAVVAQVDITERIEAEKALRKSEERFRALFDRGPIAIYSCDAVGRIQDYNARAVDLWQKEPKRMNLDERFSGAYKIYRSDGTFLARAQTPMAAVLRGDVPASYDEEYTIERPDGSRVTVITNIVLLKNKQEEITGAVCCFYDITERSQLERKTAEQAQTLLDLDRRKDEFLAMLSHELRNPLAPISNAVELLRRQKNKNVVQQQACRLIERQVGQLNHLVDDLLEVSRITTGNVRLRLDRVSVSTIIEQALETAQPLIAHRKHELTVSLPEQPLFLNADPARLEQVLVNLLTNAAKYTDEGGRVWLSVEGQDDVVVLRVRDSGIGIAPELLPRIFDMFTQAERSLDRSQGGLGIGLCLVQRLVELHGGSVVAHSVLGQGSEFVVRLPVMQESVQTSSSLEFDSDALKLDANGCRVLVVDDNVDAAKSLALLLQMTGHEVRLAFDGLSAVDLAISFKPEFVLLDIGLPGLDGYEVARRIRLQDSLKNIVLVALTGYGQDADRQHSQTAGFDHHLIKPADFDEIENLLNRDQLPADENVSLGRAIQQTTVQRGFLF